MADRSDATRSISIFGSCVSRDALEFSRSLAVGKYCARQSVVSAMAPGPLASTCRELAFVDGANAFSCRCIEEDIRKLTLDQLAQRPGAEPVLIDLIDERTPLGVTRCGGIYSLSQAATKFSNAGSLAARRVEAFSAEHLMLFGRYIGHFARALRGRRVILHRAFYAPGDWPCGTANLALARLYELAASALEPQAVIDVPAQLRIAAPDHKWGPAPYHYVDAYYVNVVQQLSAALKLRTDLRPGFSLQMGRAA